MIEVYVVDTWHEDITMTDDSVLYRGELLFHGAFDYDEDEPELSPEIDHETGLLVVADEGVGHEHYLTKDAHQDRIGSSFHLGSTEEEVEHHRQAVYGIGQTSTKLNGEPYRKYTHKYIT